jgi:hypothetical protein
VEKMRKAFIADSDKPTDWKWVRSVTLEIIRAFPDDEWFRLSELHEALPTPFSAHLLEILRQENEQTYGKERYLFPNRNSSKWQWTREDGTVVG